MDVLYIGDIPSDYHYAICSSNYIDLYNVPNPTGVNNYYRVYLYDNLFMYELRQSNQYFNSSTVDIDVSDNFIYRRDLPSILTIVFIFSIFFVILFNVLTSCFKKGGLLSDLL